MNSLERLTLVKTVPMVVATSLVEMAVQGYYFAI